MPAPDEQRNDSQVRAAGVRTLFPQAYERLRALAERFIREEQSKRALQATALVHDTFVRLCENDHRYGSEAELLAVASAQMRHVLIDHARRVKAAKRGGGAMPLALDSQILDRDRTQRPIELIDLDDAITRLSQLNERQGRLVELHLFGAVSFDEAAALLGISERTAFSDWRAAKAWLLKELAP